MRASGDADVAPVEVVPQRARVARRLVPAVVVRVDRVQDAVHAPQRRGRARLLVRVEDPVLPERTVDRRSINIVLCDQLAPPIHHLHTEHAQQALVLIPEHLVLLVLAQLAVRDHARAGLTLLLLHVQERSHLARVHALPVLQHVPLRRQAVALVVLQEQPHHALQAELRLVYAPLAHPRALLALLALLIVVRPIPAVLPRLVHVLHAVPDHLLVKYYHRLQHVVLLTRHAFVVLLA